MVSKDRWQSIPGRVRLQPSRDLGLVSAERRLGTSLPFPLQMCLLACLLCLLVGCGRGTTSKRTPIHPIRDMDSQPKYKTQSSNGFFYDRMTLQEPVEGTVAIGDLEMDEVVTTGMESGGNFVVSSPLEVTPALLERGAERYEIYCTPCHRSSGDGEGILFKRGGVPTTSLHEQRIVAMPDGELYNVITNGVGLMPSYSYPISVQDRWAIVAYVRDLQKGR